MDKIERSLHITNWNVYDKLDELVEGYNDLKEAYHKEMSAVEAKIEEIMTNIEGLWKEIRNMMNS